ncbi:MAG TPA: cbb3-type cytochrome c oxidase N-terminal domain-containing protein, partial [Planctomycetota bacterium]|nr:cbb3-type cytochrome c oxidase N-terminal domain-containing protein [Planctomycetota bacterium]
MADAGDDLLLAHEYDGIREYDNPLPGWWVGLWWATVLICFPYVAWFHWNDGNSIHDAYEAELAAYADLILQTYGDLQADEATILAYMDDPVAMGGMQSLFKARCALCHTADGSGGVGPNLTDEHWLNVKQLTDLLRVISEGVVAKGMPAWGEQLSNTQRVLLASFVAQLRRRPVAGKAPQGEP